ncbi:MAG: PorT family protein [Chitinophagaceae bacterium]|nr:MAG: PorT family protein [Chitinophagaceae bacterium]
MNETKLKYMKKTLSILILTLCITAGAFAQTSFGIKGGVQSNLLTLGDGDSKAAYLGTGAHLGFVADLSVSENFSVQPNLLFQMKSVKPNDDFSIKLYTVDLPINLLYKTNGFFVGGGPNLSFGLSAKSDDGTDEEDLYEDPDGADEAPLKRFEIGANLLMGYKFANGLTLSGHYTPGLSNILNNPSDDEKYNTRQFGISIGYMFK